MGTQSWIRGWRLAAVAMALAGPLGAAVHAQAAEPPRNVMSLSASAAAEVTMDTLAITLAVTREGVEAAEVQSQLASAIDAALAVARPGARAGQVEVRTGPFSIGPRYAQRGGIAGWQGRAELVIEGRDIPAVSRLAGRVQGLVVARVNFSLSREARERVEAEVAAQAIARFRERAQQHALAFGFSGYVVREVQVGSPEAPLFASPPMLRAAASPVRPADDPVPVEAGRATVTSTVSGSVLMTR
jgi:predicted secreted protein